MDNDFLQANFQWFMGVVEDVDDPEEMNRVRVRAFGYHTEDKNLVRTSDLPWATVMMPATSAAISGIGVSPHAMLNGTWVLGFFRDGQYAQDPVILGSLGSSYSSRPTPNSSKGFQDPLALYPRLQGVELSYNDVNINSRSKNQIDSLASDSPIGYPESAYAAKYPHNKVTKTESGHIIEIDDTPNAERIKIYHKSGTQVEMYPNGDITQSHKNRWSLTTGNDKAHITGDVTVFIDANSNVNIGNNSTVSVGQNSTTNIGGDSTIAVAGNAAVSVELNAAVTVAESATVNCPTTDWTGNINVNGNIEVTGTSTALDHISSGISGSTHQHYDTPGLGAGITTPPVPEE